jgi:hypothetical protein
MLNLQTRLSNRAIEVRALAEVTRNIECRGILLRIADQYDALAANNALFEMICPTEVILVKNYFGVIR